MVGTLQPLQSARSASRRKAKTHIRAGVGEEIPGRGIGGRRRDGALELVVIPVLPEELPRGNGVTRRRHSGWRRRSGSACSGDAEGERGLQCSGSPTLGEEGDRSGKARGGGGGEVAFRFSRRRVHGTETEETV